MVVHHVEDHFDARGVQRLDELLELLHLLAALARGRVLVVGREIADGVVAPVVAQAPLGERRVLDELVDRQQLHRGDAKLLQVLDRDRMRHAGVGAAQLLGNVRMRLAEPFHVRLVDDRAVQRRVGRAVVAPVERRVDHDALGDERHAVEIVASSSPAHRSDTGRSPRSSPTSRRPPWRTDRAAASRDCTTAPSRAPRDRARGSRSAAPAGRPASTRASTSAVLSGRSTCVCCPSSSNRQSSTRSASFREQGEVRARAVEDRTEGIRLAWPDLHSRSD